jgi:type II secretory pathway component PulK
VTRRGSVLMAVLVVVVMGAALGTSALLSVQSHRAGTDAEVRRAQSRALAWSGVQAAMREIAAQREELLSGGRPDLTGSWTLFDDELGRQGVVRLVDLSETEDGLATSESAKLDVNRATEEMLARLPGVGESLAKRIVEERARGGRFRARRNCCGCPA